MPGLEEETIEAATAATATAAAKTEAATAATATAAAKTEAATAAKTEAAAAATTTTATAGAGESDGNGFAATAATPGTLDLAELRNRDLFHLLICQVDKIDELLGEL